MKYDYDNHDYENSDTHENLKFFFELYCKEVEKLENKGTKVSAIRARRALNDFKELIPLRRREIQMLKNDL